jgi:trehalose 6-phosphate phosphatase
VTADLLQPFRDDAAGSVILLDFDGTISPIVEDPALALPVDGVVATLDSLRAAYLDVAVISGRPLSFLQQVLPPDLTVAGLYGLEGREHGREWVHPNGGAWREVMADIASSASAHGPRGMLTELKGLSITLHYRAHPEIAGEVIDYAASQADRAGLEVRSARMSVELHPPIEIDKGTIVERLAADARGALFIGDDVGDVAAFSALDRLAVAGLHAVKVAVAADESPLQLAAQADIVLGGPLEVVDLLGSLLPVSDRG